MAENRKQLSFGPDYIYDFEKTPEENQEEMKKFYAMQGKTIADITEKRGKEIDDVVDSIMPKVMKAMSKKK